MGGRKNTDGGEKNHRPDEEDRPDERHDRGRYTVENGHVHGPGCGCGRVHEHHADSDRSLPGFPTEVTFKAVFRNRPYTIETLRSVCREAGINAEVTDRESRNGTFISYTISAVFPAEDVLKAVCTRIGAIEGFYTMF